MTFPFRSNLITDLTWSSLSTKLKSLARRIDNLTGGVASDLPIPELHIEEPIRATAWNALINAIEHLDARVRALEATHFALAVDRAWPDILREGQVVLVFGRNFSAVASENRVTIGGTPVPLLRDHPAFPPGSVLQFDMPPIEGVSTETVLPLVVTTAAGSSASIEVRVGPRRP